jgi:hypothetical protein
MEDRQLKQRGPDGVYASLDNVDYLVLGLEQVATLVDAHFAQVSVLPFHRHWDEVTTKLLRGDKAGAEGALTGLLIELATSPDITEADRLALIASYRSAFDEWAHSVAGGATVMGKGTVIRMRDHLPDAASGAETGAAELLQVARAAIVKSDNESQALGGVRLDNPDAVNLALGSRASALGDALFSGSLTPPALFSASSILISAALGIR